MHKVGNMLFKFANFNVAGFVSWTSVQTPDMPIWKLSESHECVVCNHMEIEKDYILRHVFQLSENM